MADDLVYRESSQVVRRWVARRKLRVLAATSLLLLFVVYCLYWALHTELSISSLPYYAEPKSLTAPPSTNCKDAIAASGKDGTSRPATLDPHQVPPAALPDSLDRQEPAKALATVKENTSLLNALIQNTQQRQAFRRLDADCLVTDTAEMRAQLENLKARRELILAIKDHNSKIPLWVYDLFERWHAPWQHPSTFWLTLPAVLVALLCTYLLLLDLSRSRRDDEASSASWRRGNGYLFSWRRPRPDPQIAADIFQSNPSKWDEFRISLRFITDDVLLSFLNDDRLERLLNHRETQRLTNKPVPKIVDDPSFRYLLYSTAKRRKAFSMLLGKSWNAVKGVLDGLKHDKPSTSNLLESNKTSWSALAGVIAAAALAFGQFFLAHRVEDVKDKQNETEFRERLIPVTYTCGTGKCPSPTQTQTSTTKEVTESSVTSTTVKNNNTEKTIIHDVSPPDSKENPNKAATDAVQISSSPSVTLTLNTPSSTGHEPVDTGQEGLHECKTPSNEALAYLTPHGKSQDKDGSQVQLSEKVDKKRQEMQDEINWDGHVVHLTMLPIDDHLPKGHVRFTWNNSFTVEAEKRPMHIAEINADVWIERDTRPYLWGIPKDALIIHFRRLPEVSFAAACPSDTKGQTKHEPPQKAPSNDALNASSR